ncbi:MAG: 16S rRNA (cytosine(1402)-N(4))-methyltransferase RsmH [Desulfomonilaceae bacterium]
MERRPTHIPVLCEEMIQALAPRSGGVYLDGTLGAGGYAEALLEASSPAGRVIGLDLDADAVERARQRLARYGECVVLVHAGFHEAAAALARLGVGAVDGAVLDLGLSSDQLDDPKRGFSFMRPGPLDMRFDASSGATALEMLRSFSARELEEILATYGEERYCKKLARAISRAAAGGDLETTADLARVVESALRGRRGRIHPATRVFQALRIAVNREIENLRSALWEIPGLLAPGGRFCVVSYHSLEDREVKAAFRALARSGQGWRLATPKPIRPSADEIARNPRARSARMRVIERAAAVQETEGIRR